MIEEMVSVPKRKVSVLVLLTLFGSFHMEYNVFGGQRKKNMDISLLMVHGAQFFYAVSNCR